jgi:hypothetical protein
VTFYEAKKKTRSDTSMAAGTYLIPIIGAVNKLPIRDMAGLCAYKMMADVCESISRVRAGMLLAIERNATVPVTLTGPNTTYCCTEC